MTKKGNKVAKQFPKKRRYPDPPEWFAELDRLRGDSLFPESRDQPILCGNIDAEKKRFIKLADQLSATLDPAKRARIKENLARLAFGKK